MRAMLPSLSFALTSLVAVPAWSVCFDSVRAATPTARFTVNADGTATDRRTGLTWQRCPLGSVLDDAGTPGVLGDDHCVASPGVAQSYAFGGALVAARTLNDAGGFAGFTDWRVPNRKELASIVETRCAAPSGNPQVFPDTPSARFYTSTPYSSVKTIAFAIDFNAGGESLAAKSELLPVRLVR